MLRSCYNFWKSTANHYTVNHVLWIFITGIKGGGLEIEILLITKLSITWYKTISVQKDSFWN